MSDESSSSLHRASAEYRDVDLPPPDTKRWVTRRKAVIVSAVRTGVISLEEVCRRYELSVEEFLAWQRAIDTRRSAGFTRHPATNLSRQPALSGSKASLLNQRGCCEIQQDADSPLVGGVSSEPVSELGFSGPGDSGPIPKRPSRASLAGSVRAVARSGELSSSRLTGDGQVTLLSYEVPDADGRSNPPPGTQEDVLIHVRVDARNRIAKPAYGISVVNERGVLITSVNTENLGVTQPELPKGESTICVRINRTNFLPGYYTASFWVMSPQCHIYAMLENGITFEIAQVAVYRSTCPVDNRWDCLGSVYCDIEFSALPAMLPA